MPSLPLPFVVSLLLTILLIRLARQAERRISDYALIAFIGACAVHASVVGLRWSYNWHYAHYVQPILASALPPMAWIGFSCLYRSSNWSPRSVGLHFLPTIVVGLLTIWWRQALDVILVALFTGYGASLLWSARRGADSLGAVRLGDERTAHHALMLTGLLLIVSGLTDVAVALNLSTGSGVRAETLVAIANLFMLVIVGYAAAIADGSRPATSTEADLSPPPTTPDTSLPNADDRQIVAAIDHLMRERQLYRDHNLTLERLARRAGIPARQISAAVNRVHGRNVSQIVNEYRVEEARRLLTLTEESVTTVMLESGFQTKSNFNREFLRLTGTSPSDYRRSNQHHTADETVLIAAALPLPEN